jgi:uncharacterized damage-inducible protein DinB
LTTAEPRGHSAGGADQLYEYHVWSNRRVFAHLRALPAGVAEQQVASVFPTVIDVLRHLCRADELWLGVLRGLPTEEARARAAQLAERMQAADLDQLEARFENLAGRYREFLSGERPLERPVVWIHPRSGRLETTAGELLRQVCNHGTYHRGNITAMLRQMGHHGVPTDYVLYLLERQAAATTG